MPWYFSQNGFLFYFLQEPLLKYQYQNMALCGNGDVFGLSILSLTAIHSEIKLINEVRSLEIAAPGIALIIVLKNYVRAAFIDICHFELSPG